MPIYHIHFIIEESKEPLADENSTIYVNCQIAEAIELGELVHDLKCKNTSDMPDHDLAARMRYLKESKVQMYEVMERYNSPNISSAHPIKKAHNELRCELFGFPLI